jgi:hypothetical protein
MGEGEEFLMCGVRQLTPGAKEVILGRISFYEDRELGTLATYTEQNRTERERESGRGERLT